MRALRSRYRYAESELDSSTYQYLVPVELDQAWQELLRVELQSGYMWPQAIVHVVQIEMTGKTFYEYE